MLPPTAALQRRTKLDGSSLDCAPGRFVPCCLLMSGSEKCSVSFGADVDYVILYRRVGPFGYRGSGIICNFANAGGSREARHCCVSTAPAPVADDSFEVDVKKQALYRCKCLLLYSMHLFLPAG